MQAVAIFKTEQAYRYLNAMCLHFGRKVEANCNTHDAQIVFPFGECNLAADTAQLHMTAQASDQSQLNEVVETVTRHLERFAFRENPQLDWLAP